MSKPNSSEGKGKDPKADKATAPAEDKKAKGEEAAAGGSGSAPENEAGKGESTVKETREGFRPDCYEKIDKGITAKTKMVVVKLRYRLGDGTNMVAGDEFTAGQMDARIILGAMNSFHIVPVKHKPLDGEHRSVFVTRMMAIYSPDVAPSTCGKKNA